MPEFIPGLTLARLFYEEAVRPVLAADFAHIPYSAALLGSGSEILGYDTEMSTDHHWGPRLMLFLRPDDHAQHATAIIDRLRHTLPPRFRGYPTGYRASTAPHDTGTLVFDESGDGPIEHRVECLTAPQFFNGFFADDVVDAHTNAITLQTAHWLATPEQQLLEMTAGAVYHDGIGIQAIRDALAYYPRDVWLYRLACGWARIAQEEHLAPRAGYVGDELGSALIAGRLVHDIMQLCFLMHRRYAPYPKWFGTAFNQLSNADQLVPILQAVVRGQDWRERETHLCQAYVIIMQMHNNRNITDPLAAQIQSFYDRPFRISRAADVMDAIVDRIETPELRLLAQKHPIGAIDQFSQSTDLREDRALRPQVRNLYI